MQFVLSAFLRMKNKNMPEKICRETFTNRKLSFVSQAALLDTLTERPMPRIEPNSEKNQSCKYCKKVQSSKVVATMTDEVHLIHNVKSARTAEQIFTTNYARTWNFKKTVLVQIPLCKTALLQLAWPVL